MSETSPQLDYAPTPPLHRRRAFRRGVILLIVGLLVLPIAWVGRRGRERATLLYWQRQCASFSMPPGTVAYEENPAKAAALWASVGSSGNYSQIVDGSGAIKNVILRPRGQWETSIRQRTGLNQIGTVFLHARRAPRGQSERIVCVCPYPPLTYRGSPAMGSGAVPMPDFYVEVHDYATVFSDAARLTQGELDVAGLYAQPFGTVRILAGQIDPADESHFTIDFQTATGSGTIDGRLRADDWVSLTLRPAPASTPASTPAR